MPLSLRERCLQAAHRLLEFSPLDLRALQARLLPLELGLQGAVSEGLAFADFGRTCPCLLEPRPQLLDDLAAVVSIGLRLESLRVRGARLGRPRARVLEPDLQLLDHPLAVLRLRLRLRRLRLELRQVVAHSRTLAARGAQLVGHPRVRVASLVELALDLGERQHAQVRPHHVHPVAKRSLSGGVEPGREGVHHEHQREQRRGHQERPHVETDAAPQVHHPVPRRADSGERPVALVRRPRAFAPRLARSRRRLLRHRRHLVRRLPLLVRRPPRLSHDLHRGCQRGRAHAPLRRHAA